MVIYTQPLANSFIKILYQQFNNSLTITQIKLMVQVPNVYIFTPNDYFHVGDSE